LCCCRESLSALPSNTLFDVAVRIILNATVTTVSVTVPARMERMATAELKVVCRDRY
jgi:hypothetical protein